MQLQNNLTKSTKNFAKLKKKSLKDWDFHSTL